jgi:signal transduction histidine kinase
MRKLKNNLRSQFAIAAAGLGILGSLMTLSSTEKVRLHSHILHHLETAKIANHDLNENVLRLKTFKLNTYDPLVVDLERLQQICSAFSNDKEFAILRSPEISHSLADFCSTVASKASLVEDYKSEHSVLRNSLTYLPTLVRSLEHTPYDHYSDEILAGVLLHTLHPSDDSARAVEKSLRNLPPLNKRWGEVVEALILHVHSVLRHGQSNSRVETQILSPDLTNKIESLESNYLNIYQDRQSTAVLYHLFLVMVCTILGIWLLLLFRRLNEATENLHDLNANLERKVKQRTLELSDAMKKLENNQQLLTQSAKMTALGEMAGGIAHEINTPLAAILLNAEVLLENAQRAEPAETKKRLDAIIRIVGRVSKIVLGLRRFSRQTDHNSRQRVSLQSIVEDTLALCSEKLKAHSVDIQCEVGEHEIECSPEQISQVLLNFLNNSLDAMKESVSESQRWLRIASRETETHLEFSVTDAGHGLPQFVQDKLMQPFFTTKPPGVGTGLGLSISKGIIEQHGGQLIYDKESSNTRFVMRFPRQTTNSVAFKANAS